MNKTFLIIVLAVVFSRCSRPVHYDLKEVETQPVLIAYAEVNMPVQAEVCVTYPVTEYVFKDQDDYFFSMSPFMRYSIVRYHKSLLIFLYLAKQIDLT